MKLCEKRTTEIQNENNLFNLETSAEAICSIRNRLDNRSSTNTLYRVYCIRICAVRYRKVYSTITIKFIIYILIIHISTRLCDCN